MVQSKVPHRRTIAAVYRYAPVIVLEENLMKTKSALLIVDVQVDFCEGGSLAVPEADTIIPVLNRYIKLFTREQFPVFASRDWHPHQAKHFQQQGGQWPHHCVQDTEGAQFHPHLKLPTGAVILSKGTAPDEDSYSAFQTVDSRGKEFNSLLKKAGVKTLFVGGLATDFCVRWSVVDALTFGYTVELLQDAIKGVNIKSRDSEQAIQEMVRLGARTTTLEKATKMFAGLKKA